MNKIFGYTKRGGKDWFDSDAYLDNEIKAIKDPEGGGEVMLPTAIPSPFARIDLVKTAFKNISRTDDLREASVNKEILASRNDEKLVSECLDLAEMLFNIDSLPKDIKFIVWDREIELPKLKNSSDAHRRFAETLELYLDQDAESYNFDQQTKFYLIEYDFKIIGCTSPVTVFFPTADDLTDAQIQLSGNAVLFGKKYRPLYERDVEFQKYLYLLFNAYPQLKSSMSYFEEYLEANKKILARTNRVFHSELNNLQEGDWRTNYNELNTGTQGSEVQIVRGVGLRKRKTEDVGNFIAENSDFRILSNKFAGNKPLVLQNDLNKNWLYDKDEWDQIDVPYLETEQLSNRKLPSRSVRYPYLTVSDFLEPYLIRLVYPIDADKFYDGNTDAPDGAKGYLLPLKKEFFNYFDAADLTTGAPGKPAIEMHVFGDNVQVILKIPITKQDEYIHFERKYFLTEKHQITRPDEINNRGVLIEQQIGLTLFPFIKIRQPNITPFYRVQFIDRNIDGNLEHTEFDLKFFTSAGNREITPKAKRNRRRKQDSTATSDYYVLEDEFDFIQVKNTNAPNASGVVIPKWKTYQPGSAVFSFAVDFGTTNTHVEFKKDANSPQPFEISPELPQIATLFHPTKTTTDFSATGAIDIRELINHEFVPRHLGENGEYKFPHRTVIAHSGTLNMATETTYSLADFNIPFVYERDIEKSLITPNLKWARNGTENQTRVVHFIENLVILLRNKVLLEGGNLAATELIWFYPSSMTPNRKGKLEKVWKECFTKYFNPAKEPESIAESLAPFYYFKGTNTLQGGEVVSIDIGGGTSDVVAFNGTTPLLTTSFKFAANSIFGDSFSRFGAADNNGLVKKYYPYYVGLLKTNNYYNLEQVLLGIRGKKVTEDINAFFFSLETNSKIENKQRYSYNDLLADDEDLKIVFLYFYAAIIYHVAKLMKLKNLEMPKHLAFSGTGSKILKIVTPDLRGMLANFSMKIFEKVYEKEFPAEKLTIVTEEQKPKEITCKGGLMINSGGLNADVTEIRSVLTCLEHQGKTELLPKDLTGETKEEIVKFVTEFNNFFIQLNNEMNFRKYFGVSAKSMEIFKEEVNKYLRDFLEEGFSYNRELDENGNDNEPLEESLFFYPITKTINNLVNKMAEISSGNQ